jgi:hypothetical protein
MSQHYSRSMPFTLRICLIASISLLILAPNTVFRAQGNDLPPNSIHLQSRTSNVVVGKTFSVDVVANADTPAFGFGFQLEFDPGYLEVLDQPDNDTVNVPAPVGGLFQKATRIKNTPEKIGKMIQIDAIYTYLPPMTPAQGTGVVATASFKVVQEGSTQLKLIDPRLITLTNGIAKDIPLKAINQTLVINVSANGGAISPTVSVAAAPERHGLLPMIGGGIAILLLVTGLVTLRIRRRRA